MSPQHRFWTGAALALLLGGSSLSADDWPRWRGPAQNGISAESVWGDAWPAGGPKILWKAEVGVGFSSFAVAAGRVYTIGNASDHDTVFCLDAENGKVLWYHPYPAELGDKFFEGGPTSTPTVDGDRVYAIGRAGDLFCFQASSGKVLWSKQLSKDFGIPVPGWGFGGSPLALGTQLLLNAGEAGLALDKTDGHLLWKSAAAESGYTTPLLLPGDDGLVLFSSGKAYLAVDPRTGKEAWRVKWVTNYGVNAADPIVRDGQMFLSTGYGKGAALFAIGAGEPRVVWQSRVLRTQINPAVQVGGFLYGIDGDAASEPGALQKAQLKCVEFATGVEKWTFPLADVGSVSAADGKLLVLSGDGELLIGPASPEGFAPTSRAKVLRGRCWSVPVLSGGRLFCRNAEGQVLSIDVKKP